MVDICSNRSRAKWFWGLSKTFKRLTLRCIQIQDTELKTLFEEKTKAKDHYLFWMLIQDKQFPNLAK